MDQRTQLIDLIIAKSYREGDFTLSSGQKSSFYIDLKATTLSAQGADLIGRLSIELLESSGILAHVQGVGGLTLGADPVATAISLASLTKVKQGVPAFIVRKEPKGHGTGRFIEGVENLQPGARLVIVEDVSTTGASAFAAVQRVREAGFEPVAVLSVFDREQGAEQFFQNEKIPFFRLVTISDLKLRYRR